jgi:hypothetical protein
MRFRDAKKLNPGDRIRTKDDKTVLHVDHVIVTNRNRNGLGEELAVIYTKEGWKYAHNMVTSVSGTAVRA